MDARKPDGALPEQPTGPGLEHVPYLQGVADEDVQELYEKERTYRGSWKKRGGVGAFMMLARVWDRLEEMCRLGGPDEGVGQWDVLGAIMRDPSGDDGTVLAAVRDLRRYLLLVDAECERRLDLMRRDAQERVTGKDRAFAAPYGIGAAVPAPVPAEDSNRHAERAEAAPPLPEAPPASLPVTPAGGWAPRYAADEQPTAVATWHELREGQWRLLTKEEQALYEKTTAHVGPDRTANFYRLQLSVERAGQQNDLLGWCYVGGAGNPAAAPAHWFLDLDQLDLQRVDRWSPRLKRQLTEYEHRELAPAAWRELYGWRDGHWWLAPRFQESWGRESDGARGLKIGRQP